MKQSDLIIRHLRGQEELELFCSIPYSINHEIQGDLDSGRRRLDWLWVALRGERLLGRVGWWANSHGEPPAVFDVLDIAGLEDDAVCGFIATAMRAVLPSQSSPPQYIRYLPPDWRDDRNEVREVERREAALVRLGARPLVERLRFQWEGGSRAPSTSARLTFRPVAGRKELVSLMTEVVSGTLDAHTIRDLAEMSPGAQAASQYDEEFATYDSPQSWWRIAETLDAVPVGFVIPARNSYHAIIAYIGVLPAFRGHGYVNDILAEGTRVLAAEAIPRIRASTDVGNVPMANAFLLAGYRIFERRLDMVWDESSNSNN